MEEEGWVKLFRKFLDWEWWSDHNASRLFLWLVLNANHKDTRYRGRVIKRGQLVTGRFQMVEGTGISEQSIRTALTKLKSTSEITIQPTNKFSIITICKYEDYQRRESSTGQHINQQTNQQLTNNQPTTNHIQECKKGRREEEERRKEAPPLPVPPPREPAPHVFISEDEEKSLLALMRPDELAYWYEELSGVAKQNVPAWKKKYKSHFDVVRSWRRRALGDRKVWDPALKTYARQFMSFNGNSPPPARTPMSQRAAEAQAILDHDEQEQKLMRRKL